MSEVGAELAVERGGALERELAAELGDLALEERGLLLELADARERRGQRGDLGGRERERLRLGVYARGSWNADGGGACGSIGVGGCGS